MSSNYSLIQNLQDKMEKYKNDKQNTVSYSMNDKAHYIKGDIENIVPTVIWTVLATTIVYYVFLKT
jgi:hypothetical protein